MLKSLILTQKWNLFKNKTPFTGRVFKLHENGQDTVYIQSYFKGIKNGQFVRFIQKTEYLKKKLYKWEKRRYSYWILGRW